MADSEREETMREFARAAQERAAAVHAKDDIENRLHLCVFERDAAVAKVEELRQEAREVGGKQRTVVQVWICGLEMLCLLCQSSVNRASPAYRSN